MSNQPGQVPERNAQSTRGSKIARICKTLNTMKRVAAHDDVHADAYVRDVTCLLAMEAKAHTRALVPADVRVAQLEASLAHVLICSGTPSDCDDCKEAEGLCQKQILSL